MIPYAFQRYDCAHWESNPNTYYKTFFTCVMFLCFFCFFLFISSLQYIQARPLNGTAPGKH